MTDSPAATRPASRPWYREPWPWFLIAVPAASVVAGMTMLWLAIRSNDGLVADDYYKQGLAINQSLRRDQRAVELGYRAHLSLSDDRARIRVVLLGAPEATLPGDLRLKLAHRTRAGLDQDLLLKSTAPGQYEAALTAPAAGKWLVVIEDASNDWRLSGTWQLPQDDAVALDPSQLGR